VEYDLGRPCGYADEEFVVPSLSQAEA